MVLLLLLWTVIVIVVGIGIGLGAGWFGVARPSRRVGRISHSEAAATIAGYLYAGWVGTYNFSSPTPPS